MQACRNADPTRRQPLRFGVAAQDTQPLFEILAGRIAHCYYPVVDAGRADLIQQLAAALGTDEARASQIADAFHTFVAAPLSEMLDQAVGAQIAWRNPFVYAALGIDKADPWVERVLNDQLISSAEGLVGTWLEEVARIMSGGHKPGGGIDLQVERPDGIIDIYAIQMTTNTKNAGGGRSDREGIETSTRVLSAARRNVERYVGYIFGRKKTTSVKGVTRLASDEFWLRMTGDNNFLPKLLHACTLLGRVYSLDALRDVARVQQEARLVYGDGAEGIDWQKVISAPPKPRRKKRPPA
jgi:hypothetical protein